MTSVVGQRIFDLLPDYVREADEDGALLGFLAAVGAGAEPVRKFVNDADPETSVSGECEPVDPQSAPASWLPWLGWLAGVPVTDLQTADARWYLGDVAAQSHGSAAGIRAAVRATLSGTRQCQVNIAVGGDPWAIEVMVSSAEVVDAGATLRAAMREKPAGADLTVVSENPATYAALNAAYASYSAMVATGKTYGELKFS